MASNNTGKQTKSIHEFMLPFFLKSKIRNVFQFKFDNNWEIVKTENAFYYSFEDKCTKKEDVSLKWYAQDNFFNSTAMKLLGFNEIEGKWYGSFWKRFFGKNYTTVYRRKGLESGKLKIKCSGESELPDLEILNAYLYETKLGIKLLRITCLCENIGTIESFKKINDHGRRTFLAYAKAEEKNTVSCGLNAESIMLELGSDKVTAGFKPSRDDLGAYYSEVLRYILFNDEKSDIRIDSCLDDRMFVSAAYLDDKLAERIMKKPFLFM